MPWMYLSTPLYNRKGFDLGHTWMVCDSWGRKESDTTERLNWTKLNGLVVFPTYFNLSLNFAIRSSRCEPQSAPSLVFAEGIELLYTLLILFDNLDILFGDVSDLIPCPFVNEVVFYLLIIHILDTITFLVECAINMISHSMAYLFPSLVISFNEQKF